MTKAKSSKVAPKRAKTSLQTAERSAKQHRKPLAGRVSLPSAPAKPSASHQTKHDKVLSMLRSPQGATLAAMMKATGWQQHSVRGFLTGVVRRRLKLDLVSEKPGEERIYRIKAGRMSTTRAVRTGSAT